MSILVYTENWEGKFKKSVYETVSYAKQTAKLFNKDLIALSIGNVEANELNTLAEYGVSSILSANPIDKIDNTTISNLIAKISKEYDISILIFSNSYSAKMIVPRLSIKINASLINNVVALPESESPLQVKRKVFSGKAFEIIKGESRTTILSIAQNAFGLIKAPTECTIENIAAVEKDNSISIIKQEKSSGKINLSEAEIIVSAGRGLKGPENWNIIEELAEVLNAATACSKPVSDIGWRPHSEHVGQTGKTVAPNLYIAIGISGAIQHLAGVNSSKIMVVINTDPEAPFFKAADYGIVGDAFEIVPKLIEEIKRLKTI